MEFNFFNNFQWTVPLSFSESLSKCKFEIGNILYDTEEAYSLTWGTAINKIKHSIQIISVSTTNANLEGTKESVFNSNWNSEVILDYYDYPSLKKKEIKTTQGNLYSFLWKGDEQYILEKKKSLEKPLMLKAIMKNLANYELEILKHLHTDDSFVFCFPVDDTNRASYEKEHKIKEVFNSLDHLISYRTKSLSVEELSSSYSDTMCPTIRFVVFEIKGATEDIEESLKKALYVPGKNKKTDKESFRLKSHGILRKRL